MKRPAALVPCLVGVTLVTSIISSLGAPLLPDVAETLSVSLSGAQWSLTAALVAGAVAAPILGRLGDGPNRRPAMLWALAIVSLGGVLSGLAGSLPVLVAGRVMQGIGLGLAPIAMAAARDHLDREHAQRTIALLSVSGAAGVGAGYPISGLIAETFDLHAAFYFGAILSLAALVAVALAIPASGQTRTKPLDVPGAAVGAAGVVALLIGIGQGQQWGWTSAPVLGCFALAALILGGWVLLQLRAAVPLVELRQLRHRAVLGGDVAAILLGIALYMFLTVITEFVQVPSAEGYGFGSTTLVAGLCLVPFSICSLIASRVMPGVARRVGTRRALAAGSLVVAAAGVFFALVHGSLWQAWVMTGILGVGFGFTFAAIPGLITRAVPELEVGSAMGFYQVVRAIGFSIGSALVASIIAAHEVAGDAFPAQGGYITALWIGAAVCVLAAAVALALSPREDAASSPDDDDGTLELIRDDAELASAGLIDGELGFGRGRGGR
jgi:MFS family permease